MVEWGLGRWTVYPVRVRARLPAPFVLRALEDAHALALLHVARLVLQRRLHVHVLRTQPIRAHLSLQVGAQLRTALRWTGMVLGLVLKAHRDGELVTALRARDRRLDATLVILVARIPQAELLGRATRFALPILAVGAARDVFLHRAGLRVLRREQAHHGSARNRAAGHQSASAEEEAAREPGHGVWMPQ